MKNLKKLVTIAASLVITTSLFAGCSYNQRVLSDALSKSQKVTSEETNTEIGVRFSADNLSADEQKSMGKIVPMINGSKITVNTKMNQNQDGTAAKMQADMSLQNANMPLDMSVWVDSNMTNGNASFKEILKMPAIMSDHMNGKQYMVLDSSKMNGTNGMNMDFSKLTQTSQDMQKELSELVAKSMTSFNPGFEFINDKGYQHMNTKNGDAFVHVWEVKLDDKSFKDLIKYSSNNLINNTDAKNFLKEYLTTVVSASNMNADQSKAAQAEIDKSFSDFEKGLPEYTAKMNKVLDSFDNVPLIGDKGIVIDYALDLNNNIINEKGNIDLVFDAQKFITTVQALNGTSAPNTLTGVYNLGFDFNTDITNINKGVDITFPTLNSQNSIDYQDLLNQTKVK
jgi:hypothetical protein